MTKTLWIIDYKLKLQAVSHYQSFVLKLITYY